MMQQVNEKAVEKRLKTKVEKQIPGAMCLKFTSPGTAGVPDRVVLCPHGLVFFVELKRPGQTPRPIQTAIMERMKRIGQICLVIDSFAKVDLFVLWVEDVIKAIEDLEPVPQIPGHLLEVCSGAKSDEN